MKTKTFFTTSTTYPPEMQINSVATTPTVVFSMTIELTTVGLQLNMTERANADDDTHISISLPMPCTIWLLSDLKEKDPLRRIPGHFSVSGARHSFSVSSGLSSVNVSLTIVENTLTAAYMNPTRSVPGVAPSIPWSVPSSTSGVLS